MMEPPETYTMDPTTETLNRISEPVPKELIKQRKQGGAILSFLEWHTAVKLMDVRCPGWQSEIRSIQQVGDWVVITTRVTVPTAEGSLYREATGCEKLTHKFADPFSAAEAMSLKRALAKFGLGIELYDKEQGSQPKTQGSRYKGEISREEWLQRKAQQEPPLRPLNPPTVINGLSID